MRTTTTLYTHQLFRRLPVFLGVLFGCLFPLGGTLLECWRRTHSLSLASLWHIQQATPLLWIIDSAPFVLGLMSYFLVSYEQKTDDLQTLTTALQQTTEGVSILDTAGRYRFINEAYARACGYTPAEMVGMEWTPTVAAQDQARMLADYARMKAEGKTVSEVQGVRKDGTTFYKEVVMVRKEDAAKRLVGHYCFLRDITVRRQAEMALRESEERFRTALHSLHDGLVVQNQQAGIVISNRRASEILGLTDEQLAGRTSLDPRWQAIHEDGTPWPGETHPSMIALQNGVEQYEVIMGVHKPSGELTWVSINAVPLFQNNEARPHAVVVTFCDVTKRKSFEDRLTKLATTDGLTGLLNHRAFQEALEQEFARARRYNTPLSLVLLDVDRFKQYNDTFGHPAGDEVLRTVASLLQANARISDSVARYGGEEFVVVLPNTPSEGAIVIAERFRVAIEANAWSKRAVTASFGVTTLLPAIADHSALTAEADKALYASKSSGRNKVTHVQSLAEILTPREEG